MLMHHSLFFPVLLMKRHKEGPGFLLFDLTFTISKRAINAQALVHGRVLCFLKTAVVWEGDWLAELW